MVTLTFLMVYPGCHGKGAEKEGLGALLVGAASFYAGDDDSFDYNHHDKEDSGQETSNKRRQP